MRLLRSSSSSLDVGEGNVSIKYLTRKAQCLEPHERVVNIQLDEIHIKSKLSYQSKKLSKLNYSFFSSQFLNNIYHCRCNTVSHFIVMLTEFDRTVDS